MLIEALYGLTMGITGSAKKSKAIFPFVLSFFMFIILNNWFGLLPGVGTIGFNEEHNGHEVFIPLLRAGTSDMNTTLALAVVSCFFTWVNGFRFLGLTGYLSKFKNPLEIISEISRLISFTFRLFGNVFAGEVLIAVMTSLVPIIIPSAFYGLEIFFGAIQAFVFSILTLAFMNLAMEAHGGEGHEAHA
jgi:F-type H+-transporting ATPase subunit a